LKVTRTASGTLAITSQQLKVLGADLGDAPPTGLSRTQGRVLTALSRAPRGLASVRAVARRAGVSPTAASHAIRFLTDAGLVRRESRTLAMGKTTECDVYTPIVTTDRWLQLSPELAQIDLPALDRPEIAKSVPYYLRHLFWNTAPSQLDVATSASYIAKRLLATGDLDGLAWGVNHLPAEAWIYAARARGIDPRDRALALNLARRPRVSA
jgi:DNA-binding Lrp family transcriptional regulator